MELAALDVRYVVRELAQLVGAKVEKVFQSDENKRDLLFVMYLADSPKLHLRFVLPGIICLAKEKTVYPQLPPGFAMFLRKHLGGAKLTGARQAGFDRIVELSFSTKAGERILLMELMPPGNILLLDGERRVMNLLETQTYKDRALRPRQPYVAPPASFDIPAASDEELAQRISVSTRNQVVVTLATGFQLGGMYAEEACARAGVPKHRNDLTASEITALVRAVRDMFDEPIAAHQDDKRAYPFALRSRETVACETTSFLYAIAPYAPSGPAPDRVQDRARERSSPKTKLQAIIDAQHANAARLDEEAKVLTRKAELIFTHYAVVADALRVVQETRKKKGDIQAAVASHSIVKAFHSETGELELELEDA